MNGDNSNDSSESRSGDNQTSAEVVEITDNNTAKSATQPVKENVHALTVVGLGGSAGCIPALEAFFQNVSPQSGSAYVVVVHLSPEHESHLAELLGRSTRLPVRQIVRSVRLAPNRVYVIPPGKQLEFQNGMLRLVDPEPALGRRIAIDTFFRALAVSYGPQATAIVFSGTGADGTLGVRHIKEYGGLAIVQTPGEAEFDAMPRSAIATGMVDYVLPAATMPAQIARYWETSRRMRLPEEAAPSPEQRKEGSEEEGALRDILTLVRAQTGHNFAHYKRATVLRRIGRRMQVNGLESLPTYLDFLRSHPGEVGDLIGDLLISVTQFFRDRRAWEALEHDILPRLFEEKDVGEAVRAWVCGCATGEEAYTLAMLLLEQAEDLAHSPRIQVFATDMDADAINRARLGLYPETIAGDLSEERLRRWFFRKNGGYQIRKEVRDTMVFAQHDVLRDTPFSRMDLITCRNLLIYLNNEAQQRVFDTFHFALRPDGRLMLGSSETAKEPNSLFGETDKQNHLYVRRSIVRSSVPPLPEPLSVVATMPPLSDIEGNTGRTVRTTHPFLAQPGGEGTLGKGVFPSLPTADLALHPEESGRNLFRNLVERYGPPTILTNDTYDILYLSEGAGRFLYMAGGEPTRNLLQLVHPDLRFELRAALYTTPPESKEQVRVARMSLEVGGPQALVRMTVRPVHGSPEGVQDYFLVQFDLLPAPITEEAPPGGEEFPGAATKDADEIAKRMEEENLTLQRRLRTTVEQYEVVTEELKASNEELQATNEEMRSVAEELETGKEELQSVNEELSTVNYELKARVEEVTTTNSDLQNFLASTEIGTVFLDRSLRIKRYTPAAQSLFNFIPTDVGRPLAHLTNRLDYLSLTDDAEAVLFRLAPVEREITSSDGQRNFMVRLLPYRSQEDRIDGVVLTFVDITERKRNEANLAFLSDLGEALSDHPAPDEIIQTVGRRLGAFLNIALFSVVETTDGTQDGVVTANIWKAEGMPDIPYRILSSTEEKEDFRQVVRYGDTLVVRDAQDNPHSIAAVYAAHGIHGYVKVLLRNKGAGQSLLLVADTRPRDWRTDETDLLREVAQRISPRLDRARAEEALRASEARIRLLADAVPQVIWANAADGTANYFNRRWYEYTGLSFEESVGPGWQAIVHPDDAPASVARWQKALAAGEIFDTEYRLRRHDGVYCWFIGRNVPLKDAEGKVTSWFGTATDIEDLKQAEAARRESEERFRLLVEGARDYAMFLLDAQNRITFWSVGAERLFGWTAAEAEGKDGSLIFTPEDREAGEDERERQTALANGRALDRRWHLRKDGSRFWADGILMRLNDERGVVRGFAKVTRDATAQKQNEEAIQAALEAVAEANEELEERVDQRTAELAEMSQMRQELLRQLVTAQEQERGRISRDLHDDTGQLVTALLLGLNSMKGMPALASDPDAQALLNQLNTIAGEVAQKSHRLSFTLRPTVLDDIGLLGALKNYTEEWSRWSGLPVKLADVELEQVEGQATRLPSEIETTVYRVTQEALTNILKHAAQTPAEDTGGTARKRGRKGNQAATHVNILIQRRDEEVVTVIEDDGPGFDVEAVLNQPPGKRRLGIFGMQERARLAGGTLTIESKLGKGTSVFLKLPLP